MIAAAVDAVETVAVSLERAARALHAAGVEGAQREAEWLLAAAWDLDRAALRSRAGEMLPGTIGERFHTMLQRRLAREPLQYILGTWDFWSVELVVDPAVLIPRSETELLVERTLEIAASMDATLESASRGETLRIADIGTGSGCIAIALAAHLPDAEIWATDVSPRALAVAAGNAARNGTGDRIRFVEADLCAGLPPESFAIVVSNPPYVPTAEIATLEPELAWEPRGALDGGEDGLDVIRRLVPAAAEVLRPGGSMLVEMAIDQGDAILALLDGARWKAARVRHDLSGRPRMVEARRVGGEG